MLACTFIFLSLLSLSSAAGQGIIRNSKVPAPADTSRHAPLRSGAPQSASPRPAPPGTDTLRSGALRPDRLRADTSRPTTLRSDTVRSDSARAALDSSRVKGIDTLVTYSSTDSIVYEFYTKTMSLFGKGQIKYRELQLTADRTDIDWSRSVMTARGIPDTSDTTGKKFKGTPDMKDGSEVYHGHELSYNFQTKK
ncbi:MAG: hypothetical protein E6K56_04565, partial [Ignavibacteria bacterium]